MRAKINRDKLVKIIKRHFWSYDIEAINAIIDEFGANYFNKYSNFNI